MPIEVHYLILGVLLLGALTNGVQQVARLWREPSSTHDPAPTRRQLWLRRGIAPALPAIVSVALLGFYPIHGVARTALVALGGVSAGVACLIALTGRPRRLVPPAVRDRSTR